MVTVAVVGGGVVPDVLGVLVDPHPMGDNARIIAKTPNTNRNPSLRLDVFIHIPSARRMAKAHHNVGILRFGRDHGALGLDSAEPGVTMVRVDMAEFPELAAGVTVAGEK